MTETTTRYPVTFRTILQISGCHTLLAWRMLSSIWGFLFINTLVVLKLTGKLEVSGMFALASTIRPYMISHRWLFFLVSLALYSLPLNLWAIYEMTRFEFMQFRLYPVKVTPKPYYRPMSYDEVIETPWWFRFLRRQEQGFRQLKAWVFQK